jgi:hypothetical protein
MTTPLCFIDTETTGVHPDRRVWEVAIIRRDDIGERELVLQVDDVDLSGADPFGLKIGGFYERHCDYGGKGDGIRAIHEAGVARYVEEWTRGAHLVGAVPNFDADCLDKMLRRHKLIPAWHYHLVDVEAMAVGWLAAKVAAGEVFAEEVFAPPWKSDDLSRDCGVTPPTDDERHTALGDARWAMRWYDAMIRPPR